MKKLFILTIILFTVQFLAPIFGQTEQKPKLVVQTGHTGGVKIAKFSPNGNILATTGNSQIILWDVVSGKKIRSFFAGESIYSITFSPDGKTIASGGNKTVLYNNIGDRIKEYNAIQLWDLETGKLIKTIEAHTETVRSLSFSPDGKMLVSGSDEWKFKLWDIENGKLLNTFKGHRGGVKSVLFSPNGKTLASGGEDGKIMLWDVESGQQIMTINSNNGYSLPSLFYNNLSLAFNQNGTVLASTFNSDSVVDLWETNTGKKLKSFNLQTKPTSVEFSSDGKKLVTADKPEGNNKEIKIWDVDTGNLVISFAGHRWQNQELSVLASISPNGKKAVSAASDDTIIVWDLEARRRERTVFTFPSISAASASSDGKIVAFTSGNYSAIEYKPDGVFFHHVRKGDDSIKLWNLEKGELSFCHPTTSLREASMMIFNLSGQIMASTESSVESGNIIRIWNTENCREIKSFTGNSPTRMALNDNGTILASGDINGTIKILDVSNGKEMYLLKGHSISGRSIVAIQSLSFSSDGNILASGSDDYAVKLWNMSNGQEIRSLSGHNDVIQSVGFSNNGKQIVSADYYLIKIWDVESGNLIKTMENTEESRQELSKSFPQFYSELYKTMIMGSYKTFQIMNGSSLLTEKFSVKIGDSGSLVLKDKITKRELATLLVLKDNSWLVTTPEGRFDTNKSLEKNEDIHWIMPDAPFTPLSFEVFMRDYYEPNLLPRLLKCTEEKNCDKEFKPVRNLTELNRTQPKVSITNIKPTDVADVVQVTVEAEETQSEYQRDKQGKPLRSGVYDVRLFRDGQLVGYSPDAEGAVELDAKGKFSKTFTVKLPKNTDVKDFNFTAYAFNVDRVKSENANQTYTLPKPLPKVKGKALLLTIGVNAYDNPRYNLRYAANDARKIQETVGARLKVEVGSKYSEVVQIPLISDNDVGKESNNARKDIIKGIFSLLAGRREEVPKDVLERIEKIARIPAVEPEDTLIIAFSGHGYADQNGIFYMLPADIPKDITSLTTDALKRTISSDELSLWMRDITAEEMLMIVDACHSAAAVQGKDFKPGPMGSRGLGQLAYDKGMRILAATQSDNVALEFSKLQQGLLSYVLIKEGIEEKKADTEPKPDELIATEWLGYAVKQVPQLYQDILAGKRGVLIDGKAVVVGQKGSEALNLPGSQVKSGVNLQQPSLFDFRRRNDKNVLFQLQK